MTDRVHIARAVGAGFGAVANTVSLTYFLLHERQGLTSRLFISLCFWDMTVCLTKLISDLYRSGSEDVSTHHPLYIVAVYNTCFVTILIAVTRAISISRPFYHIRGKLVIIAAAVFTVYSATLKAVLIYKGEDKNSQALEWQISNLSEGVFFISLTFIIVLVSNIKCVLKLIRPGPQNVSKTKADAVKTVLILSMVFCLTNCMMLVSVMRNLYGTLQGQGGSGRELLSSLGNWLLLLNSTCNPIVYLIRKQNMRDWLRRSLNRSQEQEVDL